jgi:PAS domain S-box-containing protein
MASNVPKKRFMEFADIASDWWWELDADLRFTFVSEHVEELFGLSPAALIGQSIATMPGVDLASDAWKTYLAELEHRRPFRDLPLYYVDPRGEKRSLAISGAPQFDGRGRFKGHVGVGRDLTPLRLLEQRAVKHAAELDSIMENIEEGVALVDADLRFVALNRRLAECVGLQAGEIKPGDSFVELTRAHAAAGADASPDAEAALAERVKMARLKEPVRMERVRPDGRTYEIKINPLADGGFVMTYVDITELKAREAQLVQAQKMEAVGQLTGGVAHDFNNILMVILTGVEVLEEETLEPYVRERLDRIARAAQRAAELTRQLLAFSRRQVLLPQFTDLNKLVATTGELMRRTLGEHIAIDTELDDKLWITHVDRTQLETALINLCVNARDAMPRGGKLRIATRNVSIDAARAARHPEAEPGQYAMLTVSDTGTGIPRENLRRVFEPFFTTKEVGKGTGLGLSMVYGFIRQSNGYIEIESEVGKGTTFKIFLPRSHGQPAEEGRPASTLPRGNERILVVEDNDAVREAVVQQLRSLGYQVSSAAGSLEGLAQIRKGQHYDLLLADVVMPPPMTGKDFADEARRLLPDMRVVFMSGFAETTAIGTGLPASEARLLAKPFRKADVAHAVRQALDNAS